MNRSSPSFGERVEERGADLDPPVPIDVVRHGLERGRHVLAGSVAATPDGWPWGTATRRMRWRLVLMLWRDPAAPRSKRSASATNARACASVIPGSSDNGTSSGEAVRPAVRLACVGMNAEADKLLP